MKELVKNKFMEQYKKAPSIIIENGGRFEILGNHTDHNHGECLAATCDLRIVGAFSPRDDLKVNLISEGVGAFTIDLTKLNKVPTEKGRSQALVRGIASKLKELGYKIGGFDAYLKSNIFPGAGVSSSAAFELLIGKAFNKLFNEDKIDLLTLAKTGQYAENVYFGKKCGLLDQIGVAFGNISYIDFKDVENPIVENLTFKDDNYKFVIVNTGGSHAKLSHLYGEIFDDMFATAHKMGKPVLREGSIELLDGLVISQSERNRATHFYNENKRVEVARIAIKENDTKTLLKMIDESCYSSTHLLKNMMVGDQYEGSPLEAIDLAKKVLGDQGACKINGGGFAGSIICLVHNSKLDEFIQVMSDKYTSSNVKVVNIIGR